MFGVEPITTVIRCGRLRWYVHVMRNSDEDCVKKCREYRVEGRRPRRTWDAKPTQHIETFTQRQFKTSVPQGGILSPTLFNIYTADIPPPKAPVQVMANADDITITSSHTITSAAKKYIHHTYIQFFSWTKQNNLTQNLDKTTSTLFTPDPAEYKSNLDLKLNNTAPPMTTHPEVLDLTLDTKLTYSTHIHNISVHAP